MGLPNILNIGRSGLMTNKAAISTAGHNVANANTEGFSRQRVEQAPTTPHVGVGTTGMLGTGVQIQRVERINDEYVEKQLRDGTRDLSNGEEKEMMLRQTEDIFNEMNGEGLNRIVSRFFNGFRQLANEPDNEAVRQAVREASQAMVNDFHRLRSEVDGVRKHIDARMEGYVREINTTAVEIRDLNLQINKMELTHGSPNDLLDRRDQLLKKLSTYMDLSMHKDGNGAYIVDIRGVGPLIAGPSVESFGVERAPKDAQGKVENALNLTTSARVGSNVTHQVKGGKIGALLEVRDSMLNTIQERLDGLAHTVAGAVNEIHRQGFTRTGVQGVDFFKPLEGGMDRAAEYIQLSDEVSGNVNNIATAAIPDSPGDNRIAIAISGLQGQRLMNEGKTSVDDYYNSIVSDVGVMAARNRNTMNQQKDVMTQLTKLRDQISGVSIDEETTNLMQFQHAFEANAKVIQVADEMLKTVLKIKE